MALPPPPTTDPTSPTPGVSPPPGAPDTAQPSSTGRGAGRGASHGADTSGRTPGAAHVAAHGAAHGGAHGAPSDTALDSEAIEREVQRLRLHAPAVLNTSRSHRTFFRWVGALFLALVAALFLPWQQNVQGEGSVTALRPQDRPQTLPSLIDGRIEEWSVREGEFVKKGQPIVRISEIKEDYLDPRVIQRTSEQRDGKAAANADKRVAAQRLAEQVTALEAAMAFKISQTENKIRQYEADVAAGVADSAFAFSQFQRRRFVYDSGLVSLNEFQNSELKYQKAAADLQEKRAGLRNARIEIDAIPADYRKEIAKAQADRAKTLADANEGAAEVAKLDNKVASLEARSAFYVIRAPQDGYVVQAQRTGLGQTVKSGEAIVTVQPAEPQQAVELYVKPMDMPLIRQGDPVRLQFDGWPALQFAGWPSVSVGTFGGRVAVLDRVSSKEGKFRVLVTPDPNDEPWPRQVRIGTGVYGWTMLREVRVWFEIWRQLNGFPPTVAQPTDGAYGDAAGGKK
jgi:multidrug resistance efflux pump